ncbi:tumor necrosis factor alpha-induced protein 2 isoform X1 [Canis lupus familiaris]|uniref:tumor necrosis factor alpha-induced protein 2 isoform X1 n=1 Tax=Canis lupus familiaris TaxID=9615 RepID=UPI000DC6A786|nr:tumor necrosis factor alpha-induced protein 2 isoform X1 [Canis lupus familiaris]XP_038401732.1 tumor necrosis factor alpha-induced protein 2 isoform X1 [Canis lupus familiaris]XP_038530644.1 tumor necrosis factor alpha-induced protein 2 isoform X1 [Canis lupus familiaris]XP_048969468.1 tumor necrosis factor alpha-induced protein 2 isoform X2 [Canis lupus dingo]XP_048969469.1 tumor necrosis factor alpha-induced protein 2 isoform X2 [Canis lupus dingo]
MEPRGPLQDLKGIPLWLHGDKTRDEPGLSRVMLKMMTFFQGLPGQHTASGGPDLRGSSQKLPSTSELESEASMSEASSEDLVPPLEAAGAPDRDKEEALKKKKKKKSKGLASMLSVFTKGRKKKGQPGSAEPEGHPGAQPEPSGPLPTAEELKAELERGRLEAARPLLALERELAAAAAAGGESAEELVRRQSKVEALYVLLREQVLGVLRRPLDVAPERLRQALQVLAEQEREDRRAAAAGAPGGSALVAARPRRWLQLWRRAVAQAAQERLGARPAADAEGRSEAERAFLHMGRTMKEDLEAVVERLKPLSPADLDVVAAYAESYHEHFAAQLAAVAQFELCERDTYMLLLWVQNLYPNDIINSPKLAGDLQRVQLGSLLPPRQIRLLEATFLSNEVASVKELMARALELESQRWARDVAPQRLDSHYHSELAIDIIQIISQGQAKAESITLDLGVQIKNVLLLELAAFLRSYQRAFDEFLERCKQLRNYRANVMANINNCLSFRTAMEQKWQILQDLPGHLMGPLSDLKSHGFDTLLQSLFGDLKPLFKRFTQTRWAAPAQTLGDIISTVGERLPEFSELHDCFQKELMEVVHLHLVKEYIIRLSKRSLVLKVVEQQRQLAEHILANAEVIQRFCTQNGSSATWLHHALPTLAEIIRLQDPSAIKIEVATYATRYPDFSKGHLSAILAIKGNLSSNEVKSIRSILDVSEGMQQSSKPLFSLIKVG